MKSCRYENDVERWFDGELADAGAIEAHVAECPVCTETLSVLRVTRQAVRAVAEPETIADAQLPAFLDSLRTRVEEPAASRAGVWAFASIAAAALIVSVSTVTMFSKGPAPVEAQTVIEDTSTDIDGATTSSYYSDDGTATVWVNLPEGDMW